MKLRILHVFAPSLKSRFGGQYITWQYNFANWSDPQVEHFVLESEENRIARANDAFDFKLPEIQHASTKFERITWTIKLLKLLNKFGNDYSVIHFHVLWWGSLLAARWCKGHRIPCIYESVLLDADNPSAVRRERLGKQKVKLIKNFTGILAISEYLAEDYRQQGFSDYQVFTLMNSVDIEQFRPCDTQLEKQELQEKYGLPLDKTILLFTGSVIERKGVDLLVKAFIEASAINPDLYLLIIGPHNKKENPSLDEAFVAELKEQLIKSNIYAKVCFYGLINDRNILAEIFRASDMFVFPSRREGLGNVVLEAMASGLPVITSRLPVLERVISDGENGIFVPIGDIHTLRESIITMCNDPHLAQFMGRNALAYIIKSHGFLTWQSQLVELYRDLILKK